MAGFTVEGRTPAKPSTGDSKLQAQGMRFLIAAGTRLAIWSCAVGWSASVAASNVRTSREKFT
jgi:hypothetical protein